MSDTSQGEAWWLAGDGKWYPPDTAPPPLATPTNASLTRQTSVNHSQEASQDDAPSEQVTVGGASSTADPGAIAPPSPPSSPEEMVAADPVSGGKPRFRKPIFWGSAAAVIVIAIVAAVAASSDHTAKHVVATTTTVSLGSAGSARSTATKGSSSTKASSSANGGGSTKGSNSTSNTGKSATNPPSQLPLGGTASFSDGGAPIYDLTVTQFEDPAQPAEQHVTPKNPGDIFVAVALTFKNTGTAEVSQDIYNDTTLHDSTGQGYDGNFEATASGPGFPVGIISNTAGRTTSGWIMFEAPASSTGFTATFTPTEGNADEAAATWKLSESK